MTLEALMVEICELAIKNKLVNMALGGTNVYDINSLTVKDYPILYISPTGTHTEHAGYTEYSITLFYVDRLLEDNSNEVGVMSSSIEVLKNVCRGIKRLDGVIKLSDTVTYQNFVETNNSKLNDRCAGAFANLSVFIKNNSNCYIN